MVDYSMWDHIEISDDEDDTHPNIDTPSLYRWRHQARVERMEEDQRDRTEIDKGKKELQKKKEEVLSRMKKLKVSGENLEQGKVTDDFEELEKEEREWREKERELEKREKTRAWNVDTLCHAGFDKSVINVRKAEEKREETEEEKEKRQQDFVDKYEKEIKHFGMLRRWEDSQSYLAEHPHLACEESANYLVIWCIDLQVTEKHNLMKQVAHQTIVLQFILELSRSLKCDPRSCFPSFFSRVKTSDKVYLEAFQSEVCGFEERVRERAQVRLERARREAEEEERKARLGPGGLDPLEVLETLPPELKECFDQKDVSQLQEVIAKMDAADARHHMQRCVDSGLWVPNGKEVDVEENRETANEGNGDQGGNVDDEVYENVS
uniref:hsp90 co-chaperone Cdc37 isoform X2 n=1 Tax=Myxine glutinosa TaxID=7769 RepID=UPI00358E9D25